MSKRITQKELEQIIRNGQIARHRCGDNLCINITASGGVNWGMVYDFCGKRKYKGLGSYHRTENSLAMARARCDEYRVLIKKGVDPQTESKKQQENQREEQEQQQADERNRKTTFSQLAYDTIAHKQAGWTNDKHHKQWIATLETYAFPIIGDLTIANITTDHILKILTPIWTTIPETADRVRSRMEAVITRAAALGLYTGKNQAQWRGHLSGLLMPIAKVKNAQKPADERHHPALPHPQLPEFMKCLAAMDGVGARALEICILTATRTTETLQAPWHEFDLEEGFWVIPAHRMKPRKQHKIPLPRQAIEKLKLMKKMAISEFVFPNLSNGKHLSQAGMSSVVNRMQKLDDWSDAQGRNITVHGFRSTFRDYIADMTTFDGAMAEHALSHKIPDAAMAAYQRSTMAEKRRGMMQVYADYACADAVPKVVALRTATG